MAKKRNGSGSLLGKVFVIGNCAVLGGLLLGKTLLDKDKFINAITRDEVVNFDPEKEVTVRIPLKELKYQTSVKCTTNQGKINTLSKEAKPEYSDWMIIKVKPGTTYKELIDTATTGWGLYASSANGARIEGWYLKNNPNGAGVVDLESNKDFAFTDRGAIYEILPRYTYDVDITLKTSTGEGINQSFFGEIEKLVESVNGATPYKITANGVTSWSIKAVENLPFLLPYADNAAGNYKFDETFDGDGQNSGYFVDGNPVKLSTTTNANSSKFYTHVRSNADMNNTDSIQLGTMKIDAVFHVTKLYKYADDFLNWNGMIGKQYEFVGKKGDLNSQTDVLFGGDPFTGEYQQVKDESGAPKVISRWDIVAGNAETGAYDPDAPSLGSIGLPGTNIASAIETSKTTTSTSAVFYFKPYLADTTASAKLTFDAGKPSETGVINELFAQNGTKEITIYEGGYINLAASNYKLESSKGYTFGGWYTNADLSGDPVEFLDYTAISGGTTNIYAKWNYTVNYVADTTDTVTDTSETSTVEIPNAKVVSSTGILKYTTTGGQAVGGSAPAISLSNATTTAAGGTGFTFLGWSVKSPDQLGDLLYEPTIANLDGKVFAPGAQFDGMKIDSNGFDYGDQLIGNIRLYAIWTYELTYKVRTTDNDIASVNDDSNAGYATLNFNKTKATWDEGSLTYKYVYPRTMSFMGDIKGVTDRTYPVLTDPDYQHAHWSEESDPSKTYTADLATKIDGTIGSRTLVGQYEVEVRYVVSQTDDTATSTYTYKGSNPMELVKDSTTGEVYYVRKFAYDLTGANNHISFETDPTLFVKDNTDGSVYDLFKVEDTGIIDWKDADGSKNFFQDSGVNPVDGITSPTEIASNTHGILSLYGKWKARSLGIQFRFVDESIMQKYNLKMKVEWGPQADEQLKQDHPIYDNAIEGLAGHTLTQEELGKLNIILEDAEGNQDRYTFAGIYTDQGLSSQVIDGIKINKDPLQNVVYPKFQYTITINGRGGSFEDGQSTWTHTYTVGKTDEKVPFPSVTPVSNQYVFDGFYQLDSNGDFTGEGIFSNNWDSLADGRGNTTYNARYGFKFTFGMSGLTEQEILDGKIEGSFFTRSEDGTVTFAPGYSIENGKIIYLAEPIYNEGSLTGFKDFTLPTINYIDGSYKLKGFQYSETETTPDSLAFDFAAGAQVTGSQLNKTKAYFNLVWAFTYSFLSYERDSKPNEQGIHEFKATPVALKNGGDAVFEGVRGGTTTITADLRNKGGSQYGFYSTVEVVKGANDQTTRLKYDPANKVSIELEGSTGTITDDGTGSIDVYVRFANKITISNVKSNITVGPELEEVAAESTATQKVYLLNAYETLSFAGAVYDEDGSNRQVIKLDRDISFDDITDPSYTFEGVLDKSVSGLYSNPSTDYKRLASTSFNDVSTVIRADTQFEVIYTYEITFRNDMEGTPAEQQEFKRVGIMNRDFNFFVNTVSNPTSQYVFDGWQFKTADGQFDPSAGRYGQTSGTANENYTDGVTVNYKDDGTKGNVIMHARYALLLDLKGVDAKFVTDTFGAENVSNGKVKLFTDATTPYLIPKMPELADNLFAGWKVGDTNNVVHTADNFDLKTLAALATKGNVVFTAQFFAKNNQALYTMDGGIITGLTADGQKLEHIEIGKSVGSTTVTEIASGAFNNAYTKLVKFSIEGSSITKIGSIPASEWISDSTNPGKYVYQILLNNGSLSTISGDTVLQAKAYPDIVIPSTVADLNLNDGATVRVILSSDYNARTLPKIAAKQTTISWYAQTPEVFNAVHNADKMYKDPSKNYSSDLASAFGYISKEGAFIDSSAAAGETIQLSYQEAGSPDVTWGVLPNVGFMVKDTFTDKVLEKWTDAATMGGGIEITYTPYQFVSNGIGTRTTLVATLLDTMTSEFFTYERVTSPEGDYYKITGLNTDGGNAPENINTISTVIIPETLPDGDGTLPVRELAAGSFGGSKYTNVTSIFVSSNNNSLRTIKGAFDDSTSLETIDLSQAHGIVELSSQTFKNVSKLKTLRLGEKLTIIRDNFLINAPALESIEVSSLNKDFRADDDGLYSYNGSVLVYLITKGKTTATITDLENVVDGTKVSTIQAGAINNTKLQTLTIPETVTNLKIGAEDINPDLVEINLLGKNFVKWDSTANENNFANANYKIIIEDWNTYAKYKLSTTIFSDQVKPHLYHKKSDGGTEQPEVTQFEVKVIDWDGSETKIQAFTNATITLPSLIRTGYTFKGYTKNTSTGTPESNLTVTVSEACSFYAHYEANKQTVTLNGVKNKPDPVVVDTKYDAELSLSLATFNLTPNDVENLAYFIDQNSKKYYLDDTVTIKGDLVLTAIYSDKKATITFDPNGGQLQGSNSVTVNITDTFTFPNATKENTYLLGWMDMNTNIFYEATASVTPSGETVTMKAVWADMIKVDYLNVLGKLERDGLSVGLTEYFALESGSVSIVLPTVTGISGGNHVLWVDTLGHTYKPGDTISASTNMQLTAVYDNQTVNITFDLSNDEGHTYVLDETINNPLEVQLGKSFTLPGVVNQDTKESFLYWVVKSNNPEEVGIWYQYNKGDEIFPTTNMTFVPVFQNDEYYEVEFDAQGGLFSGSSDRVMVLAVDAVINLDNFMCSKPNTRFMGWYDKADPNMDVITGEVTLTKALTTFVAVYEAYTYTYSYNFGYVNAGDQVLINNEEAYMGEDAVLTVEEKVERGKSITLANGRHTVYGDIVGYVIEYSNGTRESAQPGQEIVLTGNGAIFHATFANKNVNLTLSVDTTSYGQFTVRSNESNLNVGGVTSVKSNAEFVLPDLALADGVKNVTFSHVGWVDATGRFYEKGSKMSVLDDTTLTAVFIDISFDYANPDDTLEAKSYVVMTFDFKNNGYLSPNLPKYAVLVETLTSTGAKLPVVLDSSSDFIGWLSTTDYKTTVLETDAAEGAKECNLTPEIFKQINRPTVTFISVVDSSYRIDYSAKTKITYEEGTSLPGYYKGSQEVTLPKASDDGNKTFTGWRAEINGQIYNFKAGDKIRLVQDTTLTATYTSQSVHIKFILNGGTLGESNGKYKDLGGYTEYFQDVNIVQNLALPSVYRKDFAFLGWSLANDGNVDSEGDIKATDNVLDLITAAELKGQPRYYYAIFEALTWTVTFKSTVAITYNEAPTTDPVVINRGDYIDLSKIKAGSSVIKAFSITDSYNNKRIITAEEAATNPVYTLTSNSTIEVIVESQNDVRVKYNLDETKFSFDTKADAETEYVTGESTAELAVFKGKESVKHKIKGIISDAYILLYWQDQDGNIYREGEEIYLSKDITLTPVYIKDDANNKTLTYEFDLNGGYYTGTSALFGEVQLGQNITLLGASEVRIDEDKTFQGWYCENTNEFIGKDQTQFLIEESDFASGVYAHIVLRAVYATNNEVASGFDITFDLNASDVTGTDDFVSNVKVTIGQTVTFQGDAFVRPGYKFAGWYDASEPNPTQVYQSSETMIPTTSMVFKAMWEKDDAPGVKDYYTITYKFTLAGQPDPTGNYFIPGSTLTDSFSVRAGSEFTFLNIMNLNPKHLLREIVVTDSTGGGETSYSVGDVITVNKDLIFTYEFTTNNIKINLVSTGFTNTRDYTDEPVYHLTKTGDESEVAKFTSTANISPLTNQTISGNNGAFDSLGGTAELRADGDTYTLPDASALKISDPGLVLKYWSVEIKGTTKLYDVGSEILLTDLVEVNISPVLVQRTLTLTFDDIASVDPDSNPGTSKYSLSETYLAQENALKGTGSTTTEILYYSPVVLPNLTDITASEYNVYATGLTSNYDGTGNGSYGDKGDQVFSLKLGASIAQFGYDPDTKSAYIPKGNPDDLSYNEATMSNNVLIRSKSVLVPYKFSIKNTAYGDDNGTTYGTYDQLNSQLTDAASIETSINLGTARGPFTKSEWAAGGVDLYVGSEKITTNTSFFDDATLDGTIKDLVDLTDPDGMAKLYKLALQSLQSNSTTVTINVHPRPVQFGNVFIEFDQATRDLVELIPDYNGRIQTTEDAELGTSDLKWKIIDFNLATADNFVIPVQFVAGADASIKDNLEFVVYKYDGAKWVLQQGSVPIQGDVNLRIGLRVKEEKAAEYSLNIVTDETGELNNSSVFKVVKKGETFALPEGKYKVVKGTPADDSSTRIGSVDLFNTAYPASDQPTQVFSNTPSTDNGSETPNVINLNLEELKLVKLSAEDEAIVKVNEFTMGAKDYLNSTLTSSGFDNTGLAVTNTAAYNAMSYYDSGDLTIAKNNGALTDADKDFYTFNYLSIGGTKTITISNGVSKSEGDDNASYQAQLLFMTAEKEQDFTEVTQVSTFKLPGEDGSGAVSLTLDASKKHLIFRQYNTAKVTLTMFDDGNATNAQLETTPNKKLESTGKAVNIVGSSYPYLNRYIGSTDYDLKDIKVKETASDKYELTRLSTDNTTSHPYNAEVDTLINSSAASYFSIATLDMNKDYFIGVRALEEYQVVESTANVFSYEWVHNWKLANGKVVEWGVVASGFLGVTSGYENDSSDNPVDEKNIVLGSVVSSKETRFAEMAGYPIVAYNVKNTTSMPIPEFIRARFANEADCYAYYQQRLGRVYNADQKQANNMNIIYGSSITTKDGYGTRNDATSVLIKTDGFSGNIASVPNYSDQAKIKAITSIKFDSYFVNEIRGAFLENTSITSLTIHLPALKTITNSSFINGNTKLTSLEIYAPELTSFTGTNTLACNNVAMTTFKLNAPKLTTFSGTMLNDNTVLDTIYLNTPGLTALPSNSFKNDPVLANIYYNFTDFVNWTGTTNIFNGNNSQPLRFFSATTDSGVRIKERDKWIEFGKAGKPTESHYDVIQPTELASWSLDETYSGTDDQKAYNDYFFTNRDINGKQRYVLSFNVGRVPQDDKSGTSGIIGGGNLLGQTYKPKIVDAGYVISIEEGEAWAPTLRIGETDYVFDGWYEEPEFKTDPIKFPYTINKDTTLYAKFREKAEETQKEYTITFNTEPGYSSVGGGDIKTITVKAGEAITSAISIKQGDNPYHVLYWTTDTNLKDGDQGDRIDISSEHPFIPSCDMTLTPVYGTLLTLATVKNTGMPVDYTWTAQNGNKFTNRVEVKQGESVDLDALANQLKGTYEYRDWWKVASGENKIENSNKYTPNGTQETLYVRYVAVMTLDSLNSKGLPVNFSWTDPLTKEKHDNTNKIDVLKGHSPNGQLAISNINNNTKIINLGTLRTALSGNYTYGNRQFSDPQGTTDWANGYIALTQNTTIYGYYYSQVTLDSLKSRGLPVKFSFTDSITKQKLNNVNYLRVLKGETINGAITRNLTNGNLTSLAELAIAVRGEYSFDNAWFTDPNGSEQYTAVGSGIPEGNMTLYGYIYSKLWFIAPSRKPLPNLFKAKDPLYPNEEQIPDTLLRVIMGDTINQSIVRCQVEGATNLAELGNILKGNYTLRKWQVEQGTGFEQGSYPDFTQGGNYIPTGYLVLIANLVSVITYNLNGTGTAIQAKDVVLGQTMQQAGAFQNATGGNYTFKGWFSDNNTFMNQVQGTFVPTGNQTIYAKWVSTITYNNYGEGTKPANKEVVKGRQITASGIPNLVSAKYYWWIGWCNSPVTRYDQQTLTATWIPTGNVTLYALWRIDVDVYPDNGEPHYIIYTTKNLGITLPAIPTNPGNYTWKGWYKRDPKVNENYIGEPGQKYYPEPYSSENRRAWINARWVSTITYNNNGLGSKPVNKEVIKGQQITAAGLPTLTGNPYTFRGWCTTNPANVGAAVLQASWVPTGNTTIYAKWVSVITRNNNGAGAATPNVEIVKGQQIGSGNIPTLSSNYTWKGWFRENTFKTTVAATWVPTGNTTIYAKWTSILTFTKTENWEHRSIDGRGYRYYDPSQKAYIQAVFVNNVKVSDWTTNYFEIIKGQKVRFEARMNGSENRFYRKPPVDVRHLDGKTYYYFLAPGVDEITSYPIEGSSIYRYVEFIPSGNMTSIYVS